jgi:hypothetical protein
LAYGSSDDGLTALMRVRRRQILGGLVAMWYWEWEQSSSDLFGETPLPIDGYRRAARLVRLVSTAIASADLVSVIDDILKSVRAGLYDRTVLICG